MPLKNNQFDEIMRRYNRIQAANIEQTNKNRARVYATLPVLSDIDDELSKLRRNQLLSILEGKIDDSEEKIKALEKERTDIITSKYPVDILEPVYTCHLCKDTGLVDNKHCKCFKKAATELLYAESNNRNIDRTHTFENFNFDLFSDSVNPTTGTSDRSHIRLVVDNCRKFIEDFDTTHPSMFLYGNAGVGKTYITDCICNELIGSLHSVVYLSAIEFFDTISRIKFNKESSEQSFTDSSLYDCDLLIIDDLGTEMVNTFTQSYFFHYLDERIRLKKSTIISSNYSLETMRDTYSERVTSRISGNFMCYKIYGRDLRNV